MPEGSPVNTGDRALGLFSAEKRVREIQAKLHRWAMEDSHRRFDDLFNLVGDPAFLLVAWDRVRNNRGGRSAGVRHPVLAAQSERNRALDRGP